MSASTVVLDASAPTERVNLRTGAEYLEALNDGRRVIVNGQRIENVAAHSLTRRYAQMVADWYDLHHDPALRDKLTFVDSDGVRRALMWFRQTDKEGLKRRHVYHEYLYKKFGGGMFARMPDTNNGICLTFIDDPEPWARNSMGVDSSGFIANIQRFWDHVVENNLNVTPTFIEPPIDRSRPEAEAESINCRVVEQRPDGIVVNGLKACATVSMYADFLMTGAFWRPGITADQVFYAAIPANSPGVTILSREAFTGENIKAEDHPFIAMGDELDNMVIYDRVLVPWERVFHVGNPEHAKEYPQRLFDWIHFADLIRLAVKAELFAGLGMLVSDSSGTLRIPGVAVRLADIIRFRESVRAFIFSAIENGFLTPGGMYKANNVLVEFGRAQYQEHSPRIINDVVDLCGRSAVIQPTDDMFAEYGGMLESMLKGAWKDHRKRLKLFRVIRDLFLSGWGDRAHVFDYNNGTPLHILRANTMNRIAFRASGPITELARQIVGIAVDDLSPYADPTQSAAPYARAQDALNT